MGLLGDKLAITYGESAKARNKGNNDDGHAGGRMVYLAAAVGGCVPLLVYAAGRVAGALWAGK